MGSKLFAFQQIQRRQEEAAKVKEAAVGVIMSRQSPWQSPAEFQASAPTPKPSAPAPNAINPAIPAGDFDARENPRTQPVVEGSDAFTKNYVRGVGTVGDLGAAPVTTAAAGISKAIGGKDVTANAPNDWLNVFRHFRGDEELPQSIGDMFGQTAIDNAKVAMDPNASGMDRLKAAGVAGLSGFAMTADPFGMPGAGMAAAKIAPTVERVGRNVGTLAKGAAAERGLRSPMDFFKSAVTDEEGTMYLEKMLAAGVQGPPERVHLEGLPEEVKQKAIQGDYEGAARDIATDEAKDLPKQEKYIAKVAENLKGIKDTEGPLSARKPTLEGERKKLGEFTREQDAERFIREKGVPAQMVENEGKIEAWGDSDARIKAEREAAEAPGWKALGQDLGLLEMKARTGEDLRISKTEVHSKERPDYAGGLEPPPKPKFSELDEFQSTEERLSAMMAPEEILREAQKITDSGGELSALQQSAVAKAQKALAPRNRNKTKRTAAQAPLVNKTPAPKEPVEPEPIGPMKYVARKTEPPPEPTESPRDPYRNSWENEPLPRGTYYDDLGSEPPEGFRVDPRPSAIPDETEVAVPPISGKPVQLEPQPQPRPPDDYFPPAGEIPLAKEQPIGPMRFFPPKGEIPLSPEAPRVEPRIPIEHRTDKPIPLEEPETPRFDEERIPLAEESTYPIASEGYRSPVDYIGPKQPVAVDPRARAKPPVSAPLGEPIAKGAFAAEMKATKPKKGQQLDSTAGNRRRATGQVQEFKLTFDNVDPTQPPPRTPLDMIRGAGKKPPKEPSLPTVEDFADGRYQPSRNTSGHQPGPIQDFLRRWVPSPGENHIDKFGQEGKVVHKMFDDADSMARKEIGRAGHESAPHLRALESQAAPDFWKVAEGKMAPRSQAEANLLNWWDNERALIADAAEEAGVTIKRADGTEVPWASKGDYYPEMVDRNKLKQEIKTEHGLRRVAEEMVEASKGSSKPLTIEGAEKILLEHRTGKASGPRKYGNLEFSREGFIPERFKIRDPRTVLPAYIERSWSRLADAVHFGPKEENLRQALASANESGHNAEKMAGIIKQYIGRNGNEETGRMWKMARDVQIATKMGTSVLAAPGDIIKPLVRTTDGIDIRPIMNAIWDSFTSSGQARAAQAGVPVTGYSKMGDDFSSKSAFGRVTEGAANVVTKYTGWQAVEKKVRQVTALASQSHAEILLKKLKAYPGNLFAARRLEQYLPDASEAIKRGSFTEDELAEIGSKGIADSQPANRMDMPEGWTTDHGRTLTQFKQFGVKHAKFIKKFVIDEAMEKNFAPLAWLVLGGVSMGYTIGQIKDFVYNRDRSDRTWLSLIGDMGQVGGAGTPGDFISAIRTGKPTAALEFIVGPTVKDALITPVKVGAEVVREESPTPIAREAYRKIPGIGPTTAEKVFPKPSKRVRSKRTKRSKR